MGFDLSIHLNIGIDPETGLAFIWDLNGFGRRSYVQSEHMVPERFRKYLVQRGSHFRSYIAQFSDEVSLVEIERFLDKYPPWSTVELDIERDGNDYWTESDHNEFLDALKWFSFGKNTGVFSISWSY
jgi:hypothetical protein